MQAIREHKILIFKWFIAIITFFAIALSGCSKKVHQEGEPTDAAVQAADTASVDTAAVEGGAPGETTPPAGVTQPTTEAQPAIPPENAQPQEPQVKEETPAPAEPVSSGGGELANYSVQKGDTLMKIAFNIYGDILKWKDLYEQNKDALKDANVLEVGMSLKYEKPATEPNIEKNGDPYLIKHGDTLGTIADDIYAKKAYWKRLWENNRTLIKDPNKIYAGFYLYYQITEQEKKEADEIKANRGGIAAPTPTPAKEPEVQKPVEKTDHPALTPADFTKNQHKHSTGLNSLLRVPASQ